jgi:CheY-like chemotaxis protein
MKLLIVEDERALLDLLGTWAELLGATEVLLATNLEEAIEHLPQADGILCDGSFPTSRAATPDPQSQIPNPCTFGGIRENWPQVAGLARKRDIPFALFSGRESALEPARTSGLMTFRKPFGGQAAVAWLIEEIKRRRSVLVGPIADATGEP